nr:MAG TPA: hypothetical protein [Caudoviricetes sp.]
MLSYNSIKSKKSGLMSFPAFCLHSMKEFNND